MMRVLVVEDNPVNTVLMKEILELLGCTVYDVVNGMDALESLNSNCPDIIFMDINLPDIDGIEVTKRIKSEGYCSQAPIYAVTAAAMKGDEEKFNDAGFDGYLAKPITIGAVKEIILKYKNKN